MRKTVWKLATIFLLALSLALFGSATVLAKGKPPAEAGNNLSFPVIWSEGVQKVLPGMPDMIPVLNGEWWYQWGTNGVDPDITPASCPPDPDNTTYCDDGLPVTVGPLPEATQADNPLPLAKAYLQKDQYNTWQAWSGTPGDAGVAEPSGELYVDWIDWGDNLESVDWYTRSQVRTEVVLFQDKPIGQGLWLEYEMRHASGWGIDEVHGLAATLADVPIFGPGDQATVYSPCARLTIQKLLLPREDTALDGSLTWQPEIGWTETDPLGADLINDPIFNGAVHEALDGPGYYNAEINVKGRIIYGYTWSVRKLHDDTMVPPYTEPNDAAAGDYRITFSFDQTCGTVVLNTFFVDGVTEIIVPLEEEIAAAAAAEGDDGESPGGGAVGVLVPYDDVTGEGNLTYMDVRILPRGGGGGGNGGGGNGGGGGGGNH